MTINIEKSLLEGMKSKQRKAKIQNSLNILEVLFWTF
jgi:hypothetical protein